jgi:hypothetical protein
MELAQNRRPSCVVLSTALAYTVLVLKSGYRWSPNEKSKIQNPQSAGPQSAIGMSGSRLSEVSQVIKENNRRKRNKKPPLPGSYTKTIAQNISFEQ